MINVAFIGCGRIADLHALGYRDNPDARIFAVCDTNPARAEARRVAWGAERAYTNPTDLLRNPEVDAVEVLTPYETHEVVLLEALRAEKHVAVQKPMTVSLASADRMIAGAKAAAAKSGVVAKLTECYVLYPPIALAKKLIASGEIGDPIGMRMKYISGPLGGWDVPPATYEQQVSKAAQGFGLETFDHGHHMWAAAWHLLGGVERVNAWVDSVDGVIDCPATIMWKCRDGRRYGTCDYNYCPELEVPSKYYSNDEWFEVTGSRGFVQVHQATGNILRGPAVSLFNGRGWRHFDDVPSDWSEGFKASTRNFVAAILGKEPPVLTLEDGREILQFSLAIARSARRRREVYLDEFGLFFPGAYSWLRRWRERKDVIVGARRRRLFTGGGTARYAAQAAELTEQLPARFVPDSSEGWDTCIGLHLTPEGGTQDEYFAVRVKDGQLSVTRGALPQDAKLTLHISAGLWGGVLLGKKRLEMAVLQGKLKYEGRAEEGLKFRSAFRI